VNLTTNSLRTSHIDFIVLLRKLAQFVEMKSNARLRTSAHALVQEKIMDRIYDAGAQLDDRTFPKVRLSFEVDNAMRVRSPLSSNEYPNSFVIMRPGFDYVESARGQFLQTPVIRANSYPMWNFRSHVFTVPLSEENLRFIKGGALEFEIFHQSAGYGETELDRDESNHLIGVAFVPLAGLIEGRGKARLTGLFDVVAKKAIYASAGTDSAAVEALGKIKISVCADKNPNTLL
jgi:hypothetical protein